MRSSLRALLAGLLVATAWLWVALIYLLQLEARNRLAGSPGESSPLYLALYGLPVVVLVSAACLAAGLALRRRNTQADVRRALATAVVLLLVAVAAVALVPTYAGAMTEFVLLPWRVVTA